MISIQEYANSRGVSGVAVRKQIQRYQQELEGHIIQESRKRMLDDWAVEFLDQHRMSREVIVEQADQAAQKEINSLKAELDLAKDEKAKLQAMIMKLQAELNQSKDKIISLQEDQIGMIKIQEQNKLLLEQKEENNQQMEEIRDELAEVKNELGSFRKSWFGFWRKK